jgi:chromosome segregation ATPase
MITPEALHQGWDVMLSPEQDFEQAIEVEPRTDELERLPPTFDWRSVLTQRRQQILQQKAGEKQTDALPAVKLEPISRPAWRQILQLREENKRLRLELEEMRQQREQLLANYNNMQAAFDRDAATIHSSQQQEIEQYQERLREMTQERNRLQEMNLTLEQRYHDLSHAFQHTAEEEARKMVAEAANALERSPDEVPVLLHDVVKSLQLRAQQLEDKHLVEVLYLKHEVQRLVDQLQQERQRTEQERQHLLVMQNTVREQSELRRKTIQARLYARWRIALALVTTSMLVTLVMLQILFLYLFGAPLDISVKFALIAPIVICSALALLLSHPLSMIRHIYLSAPHKKKVNNPSHG